MPGILDNLFQSLNGAAAQPVPSVVPAQNPVLTQPSIKNVSQMGVPQTGFFGTIPTTHNNAENIAAYARRYPWLEPYISDQNKLMQYIDAQAKRGSSAAVNSAKTVLADIYGINAYEPK